MSRTQQSAARATGLARRAHLAALVLAAACSGGSGDSGGETLVTEQVGFPLGNLATDVQLAANQTTYLGFTLALPPADIRAIRFDGPGTLPWVSVTPLIGRLARLAAATAGAMEVVVGISTAQPAGTTCDASVQYKDFTFTLDGTFQPVSMSPAPAQASATTIRTIADGPFTYCIRANVPFDVVVSLQRVALEVTRACDASALDISGTWTGTYSCQAATCSQWQDSDAITIVIAHDVENKVWTYSDGTSSYGGTVCGGRFAFVRNDPWEIELGVMAVDAGGLTGVKTSRYYEAANPACYGTCTDHLSKAALGAISAPE